MRVKSEGCDDDAVVLLYGAVYVSEKRQHRDSVLLWFLSPLISNARRNAMTASPFR